MPTLKIVAISLVAITGLYFAWVLYKGRGEDKSGIDSRTPSFEKDHEYEASTNATSEEPVTLGDADPSTDYAFRGDEDSTDNSYAGDVSTEGGLTMAGSEDDLTEVPGIGKRRAERIKSALPVDTLEDLEAFARSGKLSEVEGFGEKRVASVLEYLEEDSE